METKQSIHDISEIVLSGLKILSKNPSLNVSDIAIQDYFYNKKNEDPKMYEKLSFQRKRYVFYSEDLNNLLIKFRKEGVIDENNRFIE
jgi:hypothetical protein